MFSYLIAIVLVAAATADPIKSNEFFPNGRIVGGENAVIETYPYQVSLQYYGSHICGASIISNNYVVTAGHCIIASAKSLTVRVGSTFRNEGGRVHNVVETIRHETYHTNNAGVPRNDIALLKLETPIVFDDAAQPIKLYESGEEATPGVKAVITGWGTTRQGGSASSQLQTVSIPIITKQLCNEAYSKRFGGLPEGQICAAYYGSGGKDACQGDSGGPLAINGRLAGVVSWGNGCAQAYYPGAYTEVAHYREWINQHAELA